MTKAARNTDVGTSYRATAEHNRVALCLPVPSLTFESLHFQMVKGKALGTMPLWLPMEAAGASHFGYRCKRRVFEQCHLHQVQPAK